MKELIKSSTLGGLNRKIEEFMENYGGYEWDFTTIVIGQTHLGKHEYEWTATVMPKDTANALKDMLVEEHGYVDFFVSSEEIRAVATDMQRELSDEEVASVVDFLSHNDLETGLCEGAISGAISEICPDATNQEWDDDSDPDEACERDRERHGTDGYENEEDESDELRDNMNDWTSTEMIGI